MALKEAALRDPASQEQTPSENPAGGKPDEHVTEEVAASNLEGGAALSPEVSSVITDEVLRQRIRTLMGEKPEPHWLKRLLSHSLFALLISSALTVYGVILTNYYTRRQQEVASRRSFSDELNKIRIQKIGEVWEQIDKNEISIDDLLENAKNSPDSDNQKDQYVAAINKLFQEDRVIISKNRFWLGEHYHNKIKEHLGENVRLALNILLAQRGTDLSDLIEKRERTKQDILQIRESMLSGDEPTK
jgi:hypothetical protein